MPRYPRLPALSENRLLRLVYFYAFYGAQGVSIGLFTFAIPAWLAADGASVAQVGVVVSAAMFPWGIKFLNGFFVDRFAWLPMGRRRAWIVGSQLGLLVAFGVLAVANPGVGDVALISALALGVNLIVNFQDVSVDGLAADIVPWDERGRTAGVMFGGQGIGIAVTSAVTGWLLVHYGMRGAALACMVYVVAVLVLAVSCRERAGERLLPWTRGEASSETVEVHVGAWLPVFTRTYRAMARRECLRLWFASFAFGAAYGMSLSVLPALATQRAGFSAAEYGALTGAINLGVGIACLLLFGHIADRLGPLRMYRTTLVVGLLACIAMLVAQPLWADALPVTLMVIAFLTLRTLLNVPYNAMALGLSSPTVAATQMTLFNSASNLSVSLVGFLLGPLDRAGGPAAIVACMAVFVGISLWLALTIRGRAHILQEALVEKPATA
jgi:MFS transporter, PAT family, beta-lactamase induction signal transducer AmpG